jgi:hypothetical protein
MPYLFPSERIVYFYQCLNENLSKDYDYYTKKDEYLPGSIIRKKEEFGLKPLFHQTYPTQPIKELNLCYKKGEKKPTPPKVRNDWITNY